MAFDVEILETRFDPSARLSAFTAANKDAGAITNFLGQVRRTITKSFVDKNDTNLKSVTELYLQSYPGVTEAGIAEAVTLAKSRWDVSDILVIHRIGAMGVGEPIVLVATAATHRRAAFEACDYLMDYLKTEAVFWKKETSRDGTAWIEPRSEDYADNERWSQP